ncbi:MAG: hypothetical protein QGF38_13735, partial [Rhodospirillales bacterium]|nr:hypothetical protein [Rhodospirillales bacterium]
EKKDQENDHPEAPLETSTPSGLTSNQDEPDPQLSNRLRRPNCFDDGHTFRKTCRQLPCHDKVGRHTNLATC